MAATGGIPAVDPNSFANSGFRRAMFSFALTKAGTWYSSQVGARIDPWLVRVSGGRVDSALGTIPVAVLTVRGARTGAERKVPLLYFNDGDDVILIASSYGRPKTPSWYFNLKANPDVRLEAKGRSGSYRATEVPDGPERDQLFDEGRKIYRGYTAYEQRTEGVRRIPVMRLSPVA
jgi:deazaflavin-dependent oxidoreductase (nitroreductase family)